MGARFADLAPAGRERAARFSARLGPQDPATAVAAFPTYAGEYPIARLLAVVDLLRSALAVPGALAGFGPWSGAVHLAKLRRIVAPHDPRPTHLFADGAIVDEASAHDRRVAADLLDHDPDVVRHDGDAAAALADHPDLRFCFAFLHLDADDPGPTAAALEHLHERMSPGGLVVVDEYGFDGFGGPTRAVQEFLDRHPAAYAATHLRRTRQPSLALRRT